MIIKTSISLITYYTKNASIGSTLSPIYLSNFNILHFYLCIFSSKGDIYLVSGPDGTVTPPSSYDMLSLEERSNLLASVCGVILTGSKKFCTKSKRCPIHTDSQRREIRMRWLTNDEEIDIDR